MSDERRPRSGLRLSDGAPGVDPRFHPAVDLDGAAGLAGDPTGGAAGAPAPDNARALAGELFVHGLMSQLASDMEGDRERRVQAVMAVLPSRAVAAGRRVLLPAGEGLRAVQVAAAAMLLVGVGALSVFAASGEQAATAIVQRSIAASGAAGDRTYRVKPVFDEGAGPDLQPARLDVRDGGQHRFAATLPDGRELVAGRDVEGPWIIDHEGRVKRFLHGGEDGRGDSRGGGPRGGGPPRWIDLGESLFLAQSIDDLLAALPQDFSLRTISRQPLPGGDGTLMQRITARSVAGSGPEPGRIELWIAPDTGVVHRMELHWDGESPGAVRGARREPWQGPPGCGPRGGPADRGRFGPPCGPEGPRLDDPDFGDRPGAPGPPPPGFGPPPDMGTDGDIEPPPDEWSGPGDDGPRERPRGGPGGRPWGGVPPDGTGPPHGPPPEVGSILRDGGDAPPRRGPDGARRRDDAPPLLAAPGTRGFHQGRWTPGTPGAHGGPGTRPPRFVERPSGFGRGDRPPPPRAMIFELVSTEPLPPEWFSPQPAAEDASVR